MPETTPDLRIAVILASVRQGRRGETYARWIHELIAQREGVASELLDLRDHILPPYLHAELPRLIETKYADETARRWSDAIHGMDGYVIVTPEYNHGYPGQLKNAIDHVQQGWWYKPVGFVTYGGSAAGARAAEQLRSVAVEVRMVPVRTEVNIRLIGLQADEAGRPTDAYYARQSGAMIDQLLWWARVAKQGRTASPPPAS
ncbi:MAG TPA: NAD(P)H-dependent oxidoreductase [Polyangia bacterium]|nr:NAD(P)H-dependent oxidoreductase [Polyangia bacterium]